MMTELGLGLQQYFKVPSSLTIDNSVARKRYRNTTEWVFLSGKKKVSEHHWVVSQAFSTFFHLGIWISTNGFWFDASHYRFIRLIQTAFNYGFQFALGDAKFVISAHSSNTPSIL